jgi:hypothetical protein
MATVADRNSSLAILSNVVSTGCNQSVDLLDSRFSTNVV